MRLKSLGDLIDRLEDDVAEAFVKALTSATREVDFAAFTKAVGNNDLLAMSELLGLEGHIQKSFRRSLMGAYIEAGDITVAQITEAATVAGVSVAAGFDEVNQRAVDYIRREAAGLVTRTLNDTQELIRIRLADGVANGDGPRKVALDIVGRLTKAGHREGGLVGLTQPQGRALSRMGRELGGEDMANYFTRELRDRRYDGMVRRAMDGGKPLTSAQRTKIMGRYQVRMLDKRGRDIARTEMLDAMHHAQDEGIAQMMDRGVLSADQITETWDSSEDEDTRHSHAVMDGQRRSKGVPFETGEGFLMMRPGDTSLGAPAEEVINCRCRKRIDIDFTGRGNDPL